MDDNDYLAQKEIAKEKKMEINMELNWILEFGTSLTGRLCLFKQISK